MNDEFKPGKDGCSHCGAYRALWAPNSLMALGSGESMKEIEMDTLVGKGFNFHGIADNCFKLDDVIYEAVEDPSDGYRSMLDYVHVVEAGGRPFFNTPIAKVMVIRDVDARPGMGDTWELVDTADGHVWLTIGTSETDNWYPWFVFEYSPKPPHKEK